MANETLTPDGNTRNIAGAVTDDASQEIRKLRIDDTTKGLKVTIVGGVGAGTVTSVSVTTANGFAGTVATATTTPAITLSTTLNTPVLAGNGTALIAATTVGTGSTVVLQGSPTLTTPNIGIATATSINGLTITSSTGTITLTNAKTLAVTNTLTLSGTDSTVMTFPTTSATIARTDAGNTFTGVSTGTAWVLTSPTITTKLNPTSDDGAPLGDTTHNWSDLFLASGAVVNYANSNVVLTHTSGVLTLGTGTLKITTPTNNTTSVLTTDATQTISNKTLSGATALADAATISMIVPTVDGTATGNTTSAFVSGYTSSAIGDLVYLDSNGKWQKTDADAASTASNLLGIALAVAATDATLLVALPGSIVYATAFPTMTIGVPMYIDDTTAGAIKATIPTGADNVIRVVGFAVHADKLFFYPSQDNQTTVA